VPHPRDDHAPVLPSGWRRPSIASRRNSVNSSRNSTPWCARVRECSGEAIADNRSVRIQSYVRPIVVALAALVLPACSDYKDALVVNPCGDQIRVRFGEDEGADDPVWGRRSATMIPPMTTQVVKSAFADVGPDEYSVLVNVNGTATLIHVADVGETILVPVPGSVC
jgi:hypothetical protein